jgi:phosphoribosylpyrophosphate synthetase
LNALKIASNKHKSFIIVDDIISTGNTLLGAAEYLKSLGVNKINYFAIHDTRRKPLKRKLNVFCSNSLVGKYANTKLMLDISPVIYSVLKKELSSKAKPI